MKQCKTCKIIADEKTYAQMYHTKERNFIGVVKVKITKETYKKGEKHCRGTITHGSRVLNYCPECGRKLEREETKFDC